MTKFQLLIRTYKRPDLVSVWLIKKDGSASSWRLWGEMLPSAAEELSEWAASTGTEVVRESRELHGESVSPPPGPEQQTLFGE